MVLRRPVELAALIGKVWYWNDRVGDVPKQMFWYAKSTCNANARAFCLNAASTQTQPITKLNQLRVPVGAIGDFFGPRTTVGIPFAPQFGVRMSFQTCAASTHIWI